MNDYIIFFLRLNSVYIASPGAPAVRSLMTGHTNGSLEGLIDHLTQCGVGVDHHAQFFHCSSCSNGVSTFLDKIGSMDSNNVNGNDLAGIFIEQYLGHTSAFSLSKCLGVCTEASLTLAELPSFLFCHLDALFLGRSDHGNFRVGETSGGNGIMVNFMWSSNNVLNRGNPLSRGSMCKHHFSVSITNAVKVGNNFSVFLLGKNTHLLVNSNESTVSFNSHILEPHVLCIWDTTSGNHSSIDFKSFDMFLCLGINHFDSDRLFSGDTRGYFCGKDSSAVVNRTITNKKTFGLLGNFPIKSGH
mmetsp:Transcript_1315/g.1810  ORF Transcript_1315/g.1810 Transcript_1315/m.1810 type:complete len:301 (-) Transcript_1315:838-1740(-)